MTITMDQTAWILLAITIVLIAGAIIWAWIDDGPTHGVWILIVIAFVAGTIFVLRTVDFSDVRKVVQNITVTDTPTPAVDQRILDAQATGTALASEQSVQATLTALAPAPTTAAAPTKEPTEKKSEGKIIDNGGSTEGVTRTHVGLNKWEGYQIPLPISLGPDELAYAHGDVNGDGGCSLKTFSGTIPVLSNGTFQIYIVSGGTDEARENAVPDVSEVCG